MSKSKKTKFFQGHLVTWKREDSTIRSGMIGRVVRSSSSGNDIEVYFKKAGRTYSFNDTEIKLAQKQDVPKATLEEDLWPRTKGIAKCIKSNQQKEKWHVQVSPNGEKILIWKYEWDYSIEVAEGLEKTYQDYDLQEFFRRMFMILKSPLTPVLSSVDELLNIDNVTEAVRTKVKSLLEAAILLRIGTLPGGDDSGKKRKRQGAK